MGLEFSIDERLKLKQTIFIINLLNKFNFGKFLLEISPFNMLLNLN